MKEPLWFLPGLIKPLWRERGPFWLPGANGGRKLPFRVDMAAIDYLNFMIGDLHDGTISSKHFILV